MKLSEYCKQIRKQKNLSALAFAKLKGVSHTYIAKIETGKHDNPTAIALANIINTYNLNSNDLGKIDGFEKTNEFMCEVENIRNREVVGTEHINNINNAAIKFYNSYILENDYTCDKFYIFFGDSFNLDTYYKNKRNKAYDLCYKDKKNRNHYAYFLDDTATVRSNVDIDKIENNINRILLNLVKGIYDDEAVNITLVTSSEKVLCAISDMFYLGIHHLKDANIEIVFSRPKRPTIGPIQMNDLRQYIEENNLKRFSN